MACFLVPGAEAIVVTAAAFLIKKHEQNKTQVHLRTEGSNLIEEEPAKSGFARKLFWLAELLWGGVILLAFEHLWHGEVVPFFPFLTAATEGSQAVSEMLGEMASVGVSMAVLVTVVWAAMVAVAAVIEKRPVNRKAEGTA